MSKVPARERQGGEESNLSTRELLFISQDFESACEAAAGHQTTVFGSRATPKRRRLPIYGERDIDLAVREAYDDYGYGEWLISKKEFDLAWDIDCEENVSFASVFDVDRMIAVDTESALEILEDAGREVHDEDELFEPYCEFPPHVRQAHAERRAEFLLFRVKRKLRRMLDADDLEHWSRAPEENCTAQLDASRAGIPPHQRPPAYTRSKGPRAGSR